MPHKTKIYCDVQVIKTWNGCNSLYLQYLKTELYFISDVWILLSSENLYDLVSLIFGEPFKNVMHQKQQ